MLGDQQFNVFAVVDRAVPDAVALLRQPRAPVPVRAAGLLADAVLLRQPRRRASTIRRSRRSSAATRRSPTRTDARRHRRSASIRSTASAGSSSRRGSVSLQRELQRSELAATTSTTPAAVRQQVFRNGIVMPFGVAFVQETTVFREFGPLAGSTMRLAYDVAPKIGDSLSRQTFDGDARYYQRLASTGVLALRVRGFKSIGDYPDFTVLRRQLRDARLRLPAVRRPERRVRQRRAAVPDHRGGADADRRHRRRPRRVLRQHRRRLVQQPGLQVLRRATTRRSRRSSTTSATHPATSSSIRSPACRSRSTARHRSIDGFRLRDGRASYGIGLETFALGFPIHFDWSWRTLFNQDWEDVLFCRRRRQRASSASRASRLDRLRLLTASDLGLGLWAVQRAEA